MKYSVEIVVNTPRSVFVEKMNDPANMKHWQRGLLDFEQVEGEMGEKGSKMKMHYVEGKREFDLIETIIKSAFPDEFHATYTLPGMHTFQKSYFTETEDGKTKWRTDCEFTSDKFLYKIMLTLAPFVFKKQSLRMMNDFKAFVEDGISVSS